MYLKQLSSGILDEMEIGPSELNDRIKSFAKNSGTAKTKEFNLKRSFKNMSDSSFSIFLKGVLPIDEYKLTLEVAKDGKTYSTTIEDVITPPTDYIRLGNITCMRVNTDDGMKLVDVETDEYKDIIEAYNND